MRWLPGWGERITRSPLRHLIVLALDGAISGFSLWLALVLRFEGSIPRAQSAALPTLLAVLVAARIIVFFIMRVHRWSFWFSGLADGVRLATAVGLGSLLFLSVLYGFGISGPPRSVVIIEPLLSLAIMGGLRFSPRYAAMTWTDWRRGRDNGGAMRTVIVGAGAAGEALLRDLQRSDEHHYRVVGFVDDDPAKAELVVGGKPVLGAISDLPEVVARFKVGRVLLAIPRLPARRIREILSLCSQAKVQFKILPVSFVYFEDRVSASMLQDLTPEDLLPRDPVSFSPDENGLPLIGRSVLVTGAAGSIGSEICEQLVRAQVGHLVMVDVNENALYLLQRKLERIGTDGLILSSEIANIRDAGRVNWLFDHYRPQDVFHAAAHKHVPLMEIAPAEAVKNNILATRVVAEAAIAAEAERFVYISTDKAVRPTSVMGASKRVGEMVVRALARRSSVRFCAVRFGNVLGSAGSVVQVFRDQIAVGGPVTITHPEVRRYFMTISEAVGLVLRAAYGDHGDLCVLDMGEQIKIVDLARHMVTMAGHVPDVDIRLEFTGLRPGEKLFEELLTEDEESTSRVDRKILVATSPSPPEDLFERLGELGSAAAGEDSTAVMKLLRQLVPTFRLASLELVQRPSPARRRTTVA